MRPRVVHLVIPLVLLLTLLHLAACNIPDREEPALGAAKPMAEPVKELPAEVWLAVVNQNANVRTGPSTGFSVAFWLTAGTKVKVVARNADGSWLRIVHADRPGWIFATLVDVATEGVAEVPEPVVEPEPEPTPVSTPEPAPEPTPEPAPQTETPERVTATVTGSVVNLRQGPGTEHARAGQVRAGDELHPTGRNADGSWLQVEDPRNPAGRVWIYGPLTDLDAATIQTLAEVAAVAVEIKAAPAPTPVAPTPTPTLVVPTPTPAPVAPTPTLAPVQAPAAVVPADCAQLHTVNPNESQLSQITDWFGLDLQTVANLNGIDAAAPLVSGSQICLAAGSGAATQTTAAQAPPPAAAQATQYLPPHCYTRTGRQLPCPHITNHPEHAVTSAPEGSAIQYHAPGSYDRSEHPGLSYDFVLQLEDRSGMWDWHMRDFEAATTPCASCGVTPLKPRA